METNIQNNKFDPNYLGLSGLGGWLIPVQIGLYLTIVVTGVNLILYSIPSLSSETWTLFTSKESEYYHSLLGPLIVYEFTCQVVSIIFIIYILVNFYSKKRIVPTLMIIFYAGSLVLGWVDYILIQNIPLIKEMDDGSSARDLFRSILTCLIWIPYFLKSRRVKNTFVR